MERVDVVVVGAGVMGAASARELARRGRSVAMLEQFEPAHVRGSSHGGSRIYRLAYPEPFWIDLARAARDGWRELEAESSDELLVETGSVDHGDPAGVRAIRDALAAAGVPFEILDPDDAREWWPGMRFDGAVCHQRDGGRLHSARALRAFTEQVEHLGGVTRWSTPVRTLERAGEGVRVVTDDETYEAGVVVVAAGAWMAPLLARHVPLPPLVVTQESAFHFAARDAEPWPSFIHHGATARYGLETAGEGVKVAEHHAGPEVTADARDFVVDPAARARVVEFVDTWLPGLSPEPVSEVTCLYTNTATEDFVLDRVGPFVIVSPCSGHGFKFAPVIGRLAADLASGAAPLERFAL
ncbi:MAG: FAD-dependent oxidoreductase [Acidimicrobiia bacterium]